jgi:hypothetical protein
MPLTDDDLELSNTLKGLIAGNKFSDPTVGELARQVATEGYGSLTDEQRSAFDETIKPLVDERLMDDPPIDEETEPASLGPSVLPPPD